MGACTSLLSAGSGSGRRVTLPRMAGGEWGRDVERARRRWSSLLVRPQLTAMVAAPPLLFLTDRSDGLWAYLAVGVALMLEVAQAVIARCARRRSPGLPRRELYASRPPSRRERQLVVTQLVSYPVAAALLVVTVGSNTSVGEPAAALLVAAWIAPGVLSIYRCGDTTAGWRYRELPDPYAPANEPSYRDASEPQPPRLVPNQHSCESRIGG
jgi:hypothetical protein